MEAINEATCKVQARWSNTAKVNTGLVSGVLLRALLFANLRQPGLTLDLTL